MLNTGVITVSYIIATILFILALGGLSNQETARRGNWYGIVGMTIALLATILGIVERAYVELIIALLASQGIVTTPPKQYIITGRTFNAIITGMALQKA